MTQRLSRILAASALALMYTACGAIPRGASYALPEGFNGVVVVMYDIPIGDVVRSGPLGGREFTIPGGGVLLLRDPPSSPGFVKYSFYETSVTGERRALPLGGDPRSRQVFRMQQGVTRRPQGDVLLRFRWTTFVVGVPSERPDWVAVQERAIDRVVDDLIDRGLGERRAFGT